MPQPGLEPGPSDPESSTLTTGLFTPHNVLSTYIASTSYVAACFSRIRFTNFCLCLSLVVLKTRWVLVIICSSILLASFVERADAIICAVDSVSFFASPMAFCVSLIRSLRISNNYLKVIILICD